uniref:Apolipoprotein A-II n=1 Tax=Dicentrarchus labrax TaxID=13489 RepID=A0A8P4KSP4_DICLA
MNAKYVLALILALQVSVSLCEIPDPPQDLVEKYDQMKTVFYKRLLNAYGKLQAAAAPLVERVGDSEQGQAAKDYIEELQTKPEFQAVVKVATGLGQEAAPLAEKSNAQCKYNPLPLFKSTSLPNRAELKAGQTCQHQLCKLCMYSILCLVH